MTANSPIFSKNKEKCCQYSEKLVCQIQYLYILMLFVWFLIIVWLEFYHVDFIVAIFLIIPPIVFAINYWYSNSCNKDTENEMFQGNHLYFTFLVATIIVGWSSYGYNKEYINVIITSIVIMMLSMIDFWVPIDKLPL